MKNFFIIFIIGYWTRAIQKHWLVQAVKTGLTRALLNSMSVEKQTRSSERDEKLRSV